MDDDPATHFAFPSSAQRCHASARPFAVDSAKQGRDCLTAAHLSCSRYHPPTPLTRVHPTPPVLVDGPATLAADATRVTRATGDTRPARAPRRVPVAVWLVMLVLVFVAACAVGLFIGSLLAGQAGDHPSAAPSGPAPSGVPGAAATIAPTGSASPAPVATASPVASPSATPAPTPVPSVTPSAAPSPRVHTVGARATLTSIAAH
jgi:hypothetical protein